MLFVSRLFFAIIMVTVSILFLMQNPPNPELARFPHADKLVHFALFFVLAASFHIAFRFKPLLAGTLLFAYGIVIELIQHYVPGRGADVWDVVADMTGVAAFYLVRFGVRRFLWKRKQQG